MSRRVILGDPHLGRTFTNGVPLHRRGDREAMVWRAFEASLDVADGCLVHVCLGDLFDKPIVPYSVVLRAGIAYQRASARFCDTDFVVLRGNHDASRDLEAASAFDVFSAIVSGIPNIKIADGVFPLVIDKTVYLGWHPTMSAAEIASKVPAGVEEAVGHWDVDPRSQPFNMLPWEQLAAAGIKRIITGHDHKARELKTPAGQTVTVHGSMLPYAHGEDPVGAADPQYVTLSQDEARSRADLHDKCVRITLAPGEVYDSDLDCLQLTFVRAGIEEGPDIAVTADEFDLEALFRDCMTAVPAGVMKQVEARWKEVM